MHDYMKALLDRFYRPTEQIKELKEATRNTHKELSGQLDKPKQILLLRLVDLEDALHDLVSLESFISGYKLSFGVHQELLPPYNYENVEEQRVNINKLRGEG